VCHDVQGTNHTPCLSSAKDMTCTLIGGYFSYHGQ
jgi:hypothetical protein